MAVPRGATVIFSITHWAHESRWRMTKNSSENRIAWTFAPLISHIWWEEKTMGPGNGTLIYWTNLRPVAGRMAKTIPLHPVLAHLPLKMFKNGRIYSGWWFGTMEFYVPNNIGCHHPNWRTPSFFRGIETTNQYLCWPKRHRCFWGAGCKCAEPINDVNEIYITRETTNEGN